MDKLSTTLLSRSKRGFESSKADKKVSRHSKKELVTCILRTLSSQHSSWEFLLDKLDRTKFFHSTLVLEACTPRMPFSLRSSLGFPLDIFDMRGSSCSRLELEACILRKCHFHHSRKAFEKDKTDSL